MSDDGEDNTTSPEQRASGRAWPSLAGTAGRSAACGYHAPGRSAGMAARLMVTSSGGGEGGKPTHHLAATRGLVEEPVAAHAVGNAVADRRSLPAGLGKTQRPVDRGAGGNRCQSACPCGTRRLPPTRLPKLPGPQAGTVSERDVPRVLERSDATIESRLRSTSTPHSLIGHVLDRKRDSGRRPLVSERERVKLPHGPLVVPSRRGKQTGSSAAGYCTFSERRRAWVSAARAAASPGTP
jgi:hypothetical protein